LSQRTVHIATHGCRTNTADSSALALALVRLGFQVRPEPGMADVVIINSCTVTAGADRDAGKALRRARRESPHALLVLTGCLPVAFPDHSVLAEADLVLPGAEAEGGARRIAGEMDRRESQDSTGGTQAGEGAGEAERKWRDAPAAVSGRAAPTLLRQGYVGQAWGARGADSRFGTEARASTFPFEEALHLSRFNLKIQEGCAGHCAYCIVPTSRGAPRSRPPGEVLDGLKAAVEAGFEEIVLAGTNLLTYRGEPPDRAGAGTGRTPDTALHRADVAPPTGFPAGRDALDLAGLLELLDRDAPPCRIRVSSLEPQPGMERVVDVLSSSPRWCRHLHVSLQHGDDEVLAAMGRQYGFESVAALVEYAHRRIPFLSVGMDVIVGFPTETDEQFWRCHERLEKLPFSYLHVFAWSPRPGTRAAALPRLDSDLVKERSVALRRLANARRNAFSASLADQEMRVLVERRRDEAGRLVGLTDNYVQVVLDGPDDWMRRVVRCRLERIPGGKLLGTVVNATGGREGIGGR